MNIKLKFLDSTRNRASGYVGKELVIDPADITTIQLRSGGDLVFNYGDDRDFEAVYVNETGDNASDLLSRLKKVLG